MQRKNKLQQVRFLRTPQEPENSEQRSSVEIKVRALLKPTWQVFMTGWALYVLY